MTTVQKLKYCAQKALIQYQDHNGNWYDMKECDVTYFEDTYRFRVTFWNTQGILHEIQFGFMMTNVMQKAVEEIEETILAHMNNTTPCKPQ